MAPAAGGGKAAGWLRGAADEALVDFVKHSQRAAYKGAEGRGWAAYIQVRVLRAAAGAVSRWVEAAAARAPFRVRPRGAQDSRCCVCPCAHPPGVVPAIVSACPPSLTPSLTPARSRSAPPPRTPPTPPSQSLPAALRHSDPSRHQRQQLIAFLDGVCAEPEQGAGLERYAAWRAAVKEVGAPPQRAAHAAQRMLTAAQV